MKKSIILNIYTNGSFQKYPIGKKEITKMKSGIHSCLSDISKRARRPACLLNRRVNH